jgi:branched-subunit amino acid transport protein
MPDWRILVAIGCIGLTSYAMRAGGFLAAGVMPATGPIQRFLRLAPGNLFVAFIAAGCLQGGLPNIAGALLALATAVITRQDWAALIAGFAAAGIVAGITLTHA